MSRFSTRVKSLFSRRSQHLVFLAHVWACSPFMALWLEDPTVHGKLGDAAIGALRPFVFVIFSYLVARTYLAIRDPKWLKWEYVFPPIDVLLISLILFVSHRGPLSNLTLLFFLPIIQAAGSLNVRWSAAVGAMVVVGTIIATLNVPSPPVGVHLATDAAFKSSRELFHEDPLNSWFRVYFMIVMSSLMAYRARLAAEFRERAGVEADRNRIALEMHDGVQGSLINLASQLELLGHLAPVDAKRTVALAAEARMTARTAADELRYLVQRLRGTGMVHGFLPALKQYANNVCERNEIALEFVESGTSTSLEPDSEHALFRIAQEALTNVIKHSGATSVVVTVQFNDDGAVLRVADNGHGFELGAAAGVGLDGMRERAEGAGGETSVESHPGSGTTVEAKFPRRSGIVRT